MKNSKFTLGKFALGSVALAAMLSGCGQPADPTAAVRPSNDHMGVVEAEQRTPAESSDYLASANSERRPSDLLGAPAQDTIPVPGERQMVPSAPAPSSGNSDQDADEEAASEEEPPVALAFAAESSTTTSSTARPSTSTSTARTDTPAPASVPARTAATARTPESTPATTATPTIPPSTTAAPATTTTTAAPATTTTTRPASTTPGRYTIAQVIDGTISAGDGSNPNEEAPMGRHDAPLSLNQGWNWATGPTRNSVWGELGTGGSQYAEWRCAVIPESGHTPSVPFRVNVREGAYYQYANSNWQKAFDVDLTGGNHGGYLGTAGETNGNPFDSGSHGRIEWRREADGSFSAPWNPDALMMHFWASKRQAPASGQTAEFLTSEFRLQQPDGQTVDLSQVRVLFQCGVDYYAVTTGQGTKVPGPGIGKYHRLTTQWEPSLWVTLPNNAPADSVSDFQSWLVANLPPGVSR